MIQSGLEVDAEAIDGAMVGSTETIRTLRIKLSCLY